ncbi:hypothetical protein OH491_22045 [Termitidicoccus mucosus]
MENNINHQKEYEYELKSSVIGQEVQASTAWKGITGMSPLP